MSTTEPNTSVAVRYEDFNGKRKSVTMDGWESIMTAPNNKLNNDAFLFILHLALESLVDQKHSMVIFRFAILSAALYSPSSAQRRLSGTLV